MACAGPCDKDCPRRSATCHSECQKYLQYCEEREQERHRRLIDNIIDQKSPWVERDNTIWRTHKGRGHR